MNIVIRHPDADARTAARRHWNTVAKPLNSLGCFEDMIVRIAGIQRTESVRVDQKCVVVFCGDHGVVREGVSQSGSEVTGIVAESMANGNSNINLMARAAGADVYVIDMGMRKRSANPAILDYRQADGTANMTEGPAMTREQAKNAVTAGIETIGRIKEAGFRIVAVGEMGIGNTTAAAAMACALLGIPPRDAVGRGAGLSDEGLARKTRAVEKALAVNRPDAKDPLDVLAKVGGFDIAGMTGAFLGGMVHEVPIVIDGVISGIAALTAERICPTAAEYMLASHVSKEPLGQLLMDALGLEPVLHARMGLGEGTGAVMLFPLLDMVLNVYNSTHTFDTLGMDAYVPQGGAK